MRNGCNYIVVQDNRKNTILFKNINVYWLYILNFRHSCCLLRAKIITCYFTTTEQARKFAFFPVLPEKGESCLSLSQRVGILPQRAKMRPDGQRVSIDQCELNECICVKPFHSFAILKKPPKVAPHNTPSLSIVKS